MAEQNAVKQILCQVSPEMVQDIKDIDMDLQAIQTTMDAAFNAAQKKAREHQDRKAAWWRGVIEIHKIKPPAGALNSGMMNVDFATGEIFAMVPGNVITPGGPRA